MPTISKEILKQKRIKYNHEYKLNTAPFYDSLAWKRLRNTFLSTHPLCSICAEHGRVEPAVHIHHKVPWNRGVTDIEKWQLFLDENNLIPCCEKCHYGLHTKDKQYNLASLDYLTDKEYAAVHPKTEF